MRKRSLVLVVPAGVLSALFLAQGPSAAGRPTCLVSNERTGSGVRSLQDGIDAAAAGDTLVVKGTCVGASTITRNLRLRGVGNPAFGVATLDGNDSGAVLSMNGVSVTIENLVVTNGTTGIANSYGGTLTVSHSSVSGNGGTGLVIHQNSTLTLNDSRVGDNRGKGIFIDNSSILTLNDSTVSGNTAAGSGGGIFAYNGGGGTVTLNDSTVSANTATGSGGGIYFFYGTVTLNDSTVTGNTAGISGGGIYDVDGTALILNGSSTVSNNVAGLDGGGIFLVKLFYGTLVNCISGGNVSGNSPDDITVQLYP